MALNIDEELKKLVNEYPVGKIKDEIVRRYGTEVILSFSKATKQHGLFGQKLSCSSSYWISLAGSTLTESNGQAIIKVNDYLCLKDGLLSTSPVIVGRPWFVATPQGESPVVLTALHRIVPLSTDNYEVTITVRTWYLDGTVAPNASFDWHCIVESTTLNLPG